MSFVSPEIRRILFSFSGSEEESESANNSSEHETKEPAESTELQTHTPDENESNIGDLILKLMVGGCVMLWTVRHTWMLSLLAVPLLYALLKKLGKLNLQLNACRRSRIYSQVPQ